MSNKNSDQIQSEFLHLSSFICIIIIVKKKNIVQKVSSSDSKESTCNVGDLDLGAVPRSRRSSGKGSLENPMDRGAWQFIAHGVTKSQTRLSDYHYHSYYRK